MLSRTIYSQSLIHLPTHSSSYFHGLGSKSILYRTIGEQLDLTSQKFSQNIALISQHQKRAFTYHELSHEVHKIAASFVALGLKKHDRIGIYSPNCYEWYLTQLAASLSDLILVNINPAYQVNELEYALNKVECKALITASSFKSSNYIKMLEEIAPEISKSKVGELKSARLPYLQILIKIQEEKTSGFYNFSDLYSFHDSSHILELNKLRNKIDPDDITNIQFTSGTTGRPKGAALSHLNILNNGYFVGERLNYTHHDRICVPVPLYHCFGMVMANLAALTRGACLVYPSEGFNAKETLKAVTRFDCTSLYGVPTMFIEYLNENEKNKELYKEKPPVSHRKTEKKKNQDPIAGIFEKDVEVFDMPYLTKGIVAGALCPRVLMERLINELNLTELTNCYGMTETSPVSFQTATSDLFEKKITSVGKVLPHIECKLIDDKGKTVDINMSGEVCVRGYSVMKKYWGDHDATHKTINGSGWLKSGDIGVFDEHGYLSVVGSKFFDFFGFFL